MSPTESAAQRHAEHVGPDFHALDAAIAGTVLTTSHPDWDIEHQALNLAVDQRPAAVALPETAQEEGSARSSRCQFSGRMVRVWRPRF
jgi:hypothetical protein